MPLSTIISQSSRLKRSPIFTKNYTTIGAYLLLAAVVTIFVLFSPEKVTFNQLLNILRQSAPLGIVALGQTIVLLVAGIDLSVGAVISLVNIVAASLMLGNNDNIFIAVFFSLILSIFVGFVNGLAIAKFRIPPFLVTLAMSQIILGAYMVYTKGSPKGSISPSFRFVADGWVGYFPVAVAIWIIIWLLLAFFVYRTIWGRQMFAAGGNPRTSRLSGIKVDGIIISVYILSALLAGIAGLMLSAYIGVAAVGTGDAYTLNSIAAAVMGGAAFTGGKGGLSGTFAGVLIMAFLNSFMTMLNVSDAGIFICQGLIIAAMVAINQRKK